MHLLLCRVQDFQVIPWQRMGLLLSSMRLHLGGRKFIIKVLKLTRHLESRKILGKVLKLMRHLESRKFLGKVLRLGRHFLHNKAKLFFRRLY